ncbi:MAG TPA: hypothetical protein DCS93_23545 [Microscillaceae bacterium]|nr:hypothetical protein [Microscillaceae bacterium]
MQSNEHHSLNELAIDKKESNQIANENYQTREGKLGPIQRKDKQKGTIQSKFKPIQAKQKPVQRAKDPASSESTQAQAKPNNTGLPDNLKSGIENISGHSMDDVKVHYNSDKPAQLKAHAYAQGTDIHISPGQEQHLPHEAWHVVQQKQGRVEPTTQLKGNVSINDNAGLEKEADVMGDKAVQAGNTGEVASQPLQMKAATGSDSGIVQRVVYKDMSKMWAAVAPQHKLADILKIINGNPALKTAYEEMAASLPKMNFVENAGDQPEASLKAKGGIYDIKFGQQDTLQNPHNNDKVFVGEMLHEMMHIHAALTYNNNADSGIAHGANMHLPAAKQNEVQDIDGASASQYNGKGGIKEQTAQMEKNWETARKIVGEDVENKKLSNGHAKYLKSRIDYAEFMHAYAHYDTVLMDVIYFLEGYNLQGTATYAYVTKMLTEANTRRASGQGQVADVEADGCYITTACIQHKGLSDDCEELTVLRNFRDTYLINQENGKELIQMYYKYAPPILVSIKRREDEDEILAKLYGVITDCVNAIKQGDNEYAYKTYVKMVLELKNRFSSDTVIPEHLQVEQLSAGIAA